MKNIEINRQQNYYRWFEYLPGLITWGVFAGVIVLSFFAPTIFAILMIIYSISWLLKAIIMSARLIIGYKKYKHDVAMDWTKKYHQTKDKIKRPDDIYHVVIMATYKESYETLKYSLDSIIKSKYPLDKVIFVLATEERAHEIGTNNARKLNKAYGDKFLKFAHIEHPKDLPNEIVGKGANITYAAKQILKYLDKKNISYRDVLVTTLDADHRPHEQYFSAISYAYITSDDPVHKSYQPLPMFFNNIWHIPIPIRSISIGSSFWQMIESTRSDRMRNFAAHAQPLEALIQTDFWSKLTIVEDGHQFWRSYYAFDGNHKVVPINVPIYQDAVLSPDGYMQTFKEQYLQKKRWAWGCSDIPYVITNNLKDKKILFSEKWSQALRLLDGHISWSITSIILFVAGWLPMIINPDFAKTVVAFNFPLIYSRILTVAMIGMVITLSISTLMLPPKPKKSFNLSVLLEWIITPFMLPFSNILFSSFPAIHAQTLLMMGKYMGFHVTAKKAVKYKKQSKF